MYRPIRSIALRAAVAWAASWPALAAADYTVMCQSLGNQHNSCPISGSSHVRLSRQISNAPCVQGRTWGYDWRAIWVDEGCRAEFQVRGHASSNNTDGAAAAAGIVLGAAIIGALFGNKNPPENAGPAGPPAGSAGPAPDWMVGTFFGRLPANGAEVVMTITPDGSVSAVASGKSARGYVSGQRLYVEGGIFDVTPTQAGFITSQRGHPQNEVYYQRRQ